MAKGQSIHQEQPERRPPPMAYVDLDKLKNADGIVAIISQRVSNGMITFALFREYERDGSVEKTSFFPESLRGSFQDMVRLAFERIDEISTNPDLLEELQRKGGLDTRRARDHRDRR